MLRIFAISAIALGASATTLPAGMHARAHAPVRDDTQFKQALQSKWNPAESMAKAAQSAERSTKRAAERAGKSAERNTKAVIGERNVKAVKRAADAAENAAKAAAAQVERNNKAVAEGAAKAAEKVDKAIRAKAIERSSKERNSKDAVERSAKSVAERVAKARAEAERVAKVAAEKVAKTAEKAAKVRHCVSSWAGWTSCTKKCGTGSQTNTLVIAQQSRFGGRACPTTTSQSRRCNTAPCPVNGGWSDFGAWSDCSKSCDGGTTTQIRKCDSPKPAFGGDDCAGSAKSTKSCNSHTCFCPSCKYVNGRMSVFHETLHEQHEGRVHGPRTVHKSCAAGSKAGACTKSYVMAHSCHFNSKTGCKCVCKKPDVSEKRNEFEIPEKMNPQDLTNYIRSHNIV